PHMTLHRRTVLSTLAVVLLSVGACSPMDATSSDVGTESQALLGSMKWFGYYFSAADTIDYTDEVKDHSNFVFIATARGDWFARVQHAQSSGMKVVLDVK